MWKKLISVFISRGRNSWGKFIIVTRSWLLQYRLFLHNGIYSDCLLQLYHWLLAYFFCWCYFSVSGYIYFIHLFCRSQIKIYCFSFQDRGKRLKLQQFIVKKAAALYETSWMEGDNDPQDRLPAEEGRFKIQPSGIHHREIKLKYSLFFPRWF